MCLELDWNEVIKVAIDCSIPGFRKAYVADNYYYFFATKRKVAGGVCVEGWQEGKRKATYGMD